MVRAHGGRRGCALVFAAVLMLSHTSCSKSEKREESDSLKAARLIDSNRTDEAISLLEGKRKLLPGSVELHLALASAYAHKAGISFPKIFAAIKNSEEIKDGIFEAGQTKDIGTHSEAVDNEILRAVQILTTMSATLRSVEQIPRIDKAHFNFLLKAIEIINQVDKDLQPKDLVYRLILQIIAFKHVFFEEVIGQISARIDADELCTLNLFSWQDSVLDSGKLLLDIYNDMERIEPTKEKIENMAELKNRTKDAILSLTRGAENLTLIDSAMEAFGRQGIVKNDLGKFLKCGDGGD